MAIPQIEKFKSPGSEYRGKPFWAWNTRLEKEELLRQINVLKEMGLGGHFMHARVGLNTPYLSDEWFECIRTCVDESEKLGMEAWLYDEDRWPSGAAGGFVTRDPRYRMKMVLAEELEDISAAAKGGNTLSWYAIRLEDGKLTAYRRLSDPEKALLQPGEIFLHCYWMNNHEESWFNDQCYLDTLNPEGVKKFLEVTHEAYYRKFGGKFGNVIPGIFCDEPNYRHCTREAKSHPWTLAIPEKFQAKYGYDLLDFMPELFYPMPEVFKRSRCNYYDLLTELFVTSYSKTIGEWCKDHNLKLTGHVLLEDSMHRQTRSVGAAMRFYQYMQAPGVDLLTEHWNVFNTVKQCVSVARQMGRKVRLSESYGCTGWDFPFLGHKALGDWQFALGINLRCQHLMWYSMEAEAKRDFQQTDPPVIQRIADRFDFIGRDPAQDGDQRTFCGILFIRFHIHISLDFNKCGSRRSGHP